MYDHRIRRMTDYGTARAPLSLATPGDGAKPEEPTHER
jgi:hypothetical protein